MKPLLPTGPIVRLGNSGIGLAQKHWSAGRDLADEEQRCGMIVRLRDTLSSSTSSSASSSASLPPLNAVVKAQSSDFQVNEINSNGSGSFLEKRPTGRWRKISRQKTLLIENSSTPFSDPDKSFVPTVQSYGEYVRLLGKLPKGQPVLQFTMFNDSYSLESILNRFRYEIGVSHDAVHMQRAPGGHFGCTTQSGFCLGVSKEQIAHVSRHYNLHPLVFDPRSYYPVEEVPSLLQPPRGYLYRVLLRCVEEPKEAILRQLEAFNKHGFINYFGVERFGTGDTAQFAMSSLSSRGEYERAMGCCLQNLVDTEPFHAKEFMSYMNSEDSTALSIANEWYHSCKAARDVKAQKIIAALVSYHSGATDLKTLWEGLGIDAHAHASAAEFVWNAMASQRMLSYGQEPQVGDVVIPKGEADGAAPHTPKIIESAEECKQYSIEDVVLPVPYHDSPLSTALFPQVGSLTESLFREFATSQKLDKLFSPQDEATAKSREVVYRHLVRKTSNLQAAVVHDPTSLSVLKNDLFLLQERKPISGFDLNYSDRVREPSVFNVSERFNERMASMRAHHKGENSLVLSFALPADASPLVALREIFALKYANYNDLYFTY